MHFRFLVEDLSGKEAMAVLVPKIISDDATYDIHHYKGIGRIPTNLRPKTDASKRILLDCLPSILRGLGRNPHCGTVVVICDLDDRDKHKFLVELNDVLEACNLSQKLFSALQ